MPDSLKALSTVQTGDIMDRLLGARNLAEHPAAVKLESLLYKDPGKLSEEQRGSSQVERVWTPHKDEVAVKVSGRRANIKVSIGPTSPADASINDLAEVAVKAIVKELRRSSE